MLLGSIGLLTSATASLCSAQATQFPPIRSEAREVVLPVFVVQEEMDPRGLLLGPNGEHLHVWIHHAQEVTGLSAKSLAVFEDGMEQRIQISALNRKVFGLLRTTSENTQRPRGLHLEFGVQRM